jgi:hypothetical protein
MKLGTWVLNIWFFGTALAVLAWLWMLGDLAAGSWNWAAFAILVPLPLSLCWLVYAVLRAYSVARRWHLAAAILATLLVYPLIYQPWNPRCVFVRKLESIQPGMSDADVRSIMGGYIGGERFETKLIYVPDELRPQTVTHEMSYRWNEDDGRYNSDIGQVFLHGRTVVGVRFLPD